MPTQPTEDAFVSAQIPEVVYLNYHEFRRRLVLASGQSAPQTLAVRFEGAPGSGATDFAAHARVVEFVRRGDGEPSELPEYDCAGCIYCAPLGLAAGLTTGALAPRLEAIREEVTNLRLGLGRAQNETDQFFAINNTLTELRVAVQAVERKVKRPARALAKKRRR